jgi:hypothetical protein
MSNKYSIIKLVEKGQRTTNYFSGDTLAFKTEWRETRHTMEYVKCSGIYFKTIKEAKEYRSQCINNDVKLLEISDDNIGTRILSYIEDDGSGYAYYDKTIDKYWYGTDLVKVRYKIYLVDEEDIETWNKYRE